MKPTILVFLLILSMMGTAVGLPLLGLDDPITKLMANSGVDVVYDGTYLWIGTAKGLSGTDNGGMEWRSYDASNGLLSNEISALAYGNGQLWVGNSSSIVSQGQAIPVGEGFSLTTNYGSSFQTFTPYQASSPGMLCYDIAVHDTIVYAACFYGGLIYTRDNGDTWENLFVDESAMDDFYDSTFSDYNNRFFSVAIDDNYEDTVVVWGGTAEGVNQFQFIKRNAKLAGNSIVDFAMQGEYTWLATTLGLSRSENDGISYKSWFEDDGLTSDYTSAVAAFNNFLICAGYDDTESEGAGFAYSTDYGESWTQSLPSEAIGSEKKAEDIVISYYGDNDDFIVWSACSDGGLIRSLDSGQTWEQVVLDNVYTSPDSAFNKIYSLAISYPLSELSTCEEGDTLDIIAGCASGVWLLKMPCPYDGAIASAELIRFDDIDYAGRKVLAIGANRWTDGEDEDTIYEWSLATIPYNGEGSISIMTTQDRGQTWSTSFIGDRVNDLIYTTGIIWAATDIGLYRYNRSSSSWSVIALGDNTEDIEIDTITTALLFDDIDTVLWIGSEDGLGTSYNGLPNTWDIDTVNIDPEYFDYNIQKTYEDENGLCGNFTIALEVQYYEGNRYIWVAANSTGNSGEANGINLSTDNGETWSILLTGVSAWNFAFDGADVYAASSLGLLKTSDFGLSWDTLQLVDASSGTEIYSGTEFYGVGVADGVIWAASDDGMARSEDGTTWSIYRTFEDVDSDGGAKAYASPVPSSPYSTPGGHVRFHYVFDNPGNVTIKVYDFAMKLVATPVDGEYREGNQQYDNDNWDMRNDNGDVVATGPYYFKVENSSGEEVWGKLMVIP